MAVQTRFEPTDWERAVEVEGGAALRIVATMGVLPPARVDVEETTDTVRLGGRGRQTVVRPPPMSSRDRRR